MTDVRVVVADDGRGVGSADLAERQAEGHVGLVVLRGLLVDAGGSLEVGPGDPSGTRLRATVPVR